MSKRVSCPNTKWTATHITMNEDGSCYSRCSRSFFSPIWTTSPLIEIDLMLRNTKPTINLFTRSFYRPSMSVFVTVHRSAYPCWSVGKAPAHRKHARSFTPLSEINESLGQNGPIVNSFLISWSTQPPACHWCKMRRMECTNFSTFYHTPVSKTEALSVVHFRN